MTGEPRPWERAEHRLHRRHRSLARPTVTRANRRWQLKQRQGATSTEWVPSPKESGKRITFLKGCPAGLLRKSRAALGSERVRAALGSDGARGPAGEDPASFGLGSLSGSTLAALKLNRSRTRTRYAPHRVLSQTSQLRQNTRGDPERTPVSPSNSRDHADFQ